MKSEVNTFDYSAAMQPWFEKINRTWIEKYFFIEPQDNIVLGHPEEVFLRDGGAVLFASLNNQIAGTVALKNEGHGIFELAKMGVDDQYQGNGLGSTLINAAIRKAKLLGAERLVLYSNTKLAAAIHLYRKFGFKEVPLENGRLARCNIKMELLLSPVIIQKVGPEHAATVAAIGRESFRETFANFFNKTEDLDQYLHQTYDPGKITNGMFRPGNVFIIAFYNKEPAGFAKMKTLSLNKHITSPHQTELQKIYFLKKFQGKGIASMLMQNVLSEAKETGSEYVWLDVMIENGRAIQFYQKNGFTRCGNHSFQIGSQIFYYDVMHRSLMSISKES